MDTCALDVAQDPRYTLHSLPQPPALLTLSFNSTVLKRSRSPPKQISRKFFLPSVSQKCDGEGIEVLTAVQTEVTLLNKTSKNCCLLNRSLNAAGDMALLGPFSSRGTCCFANAAQR